MFGAQFIPELDCEQALAEIMEIIEDESRFAFEKIEDISKLLERFR